MLIEQINDEVSKEIWEKVASPRVAVQIYLKTSCYPSRWQAKAVVRHARRVLCPIHTADVRRRNNLTVEFRHVGRYEFTITASSPNTSGPVRAVGLLWTGYIIRYTVELFHTNKLVV